MEKQDRKEHLDQVQNKSEANEDKKDQPVHKGQRVTKVPMVKMEHLEVLEKVAPQVALDQPENKEIKVNAIHTRF